MQLGARKLAQRPGRSPPPLPTRIESTYSRHENFRFGFGWAGAFHSVDHHTFAVAFQQAEVDQYLITWPISYVSDGSVKITGGVTTTIIIPVQHLLRISLHPKSNIRASLVRGEPRLMTWSHSYEENARDLTIRAEELQLAAERQRPPNSTCPKPSLSTSHKGQSM